MERCSTGAPRQRSQQSNSGPSTLHHDLTAHHGGPRTRLANCSGVPGLDRRIQVPGHEIGVKTGISLELWKAIFPYARIVGADIKPLKHALPEGITFVEADCDKADVSPERDFLDKCLRYLDETGHDSIEIQFR